MKDILSLLLNKNENLYSTNQMPIWLMRQAGRYLPEYMNIRKHYDSFLDLCYSKDVSAEITLQPVKRFDLDAAILFSDILVVPDILGMKVEFLKNHGPKLDVFSDYSFETLNKLNVSNDNKQFSSISETIKIVRRELDPKKTLIGFAGSPWTVITYMIESDRSNKFNTIRSLIFSKKDFMQKLVNIITEQTVLYLEMQILSGVNVIKLFDSWSGVLRKDHYDAYVIKPTAKIVKCIKDKYPNIPIIGFPKDSKNMYNSYIKETNVDCIALDQLIDIKTFKTNIPTQGNLDPVLLTMDDIQPLKNEIDNILESCKGKKHIFNVGHGVTPNTKIYNVEFLINYIRNKT